MLALAPAACLDYIDSEFMKRQHHGEHAGFTLSGHILRNVSILDTKEEGFRKLPSSITATHAPIQHAIWHGHKLFLSQPMVYNFLCDDWMGGGWRQYTRHQKFWCQAGLVAFSWLIVPLNCLLLALFTMFPPLATWCVRRTRPRNALAL